MAHPGQSKLVQPSPTKSNQIQPGPPGRHRIGFSPLKFAGDFGDAGLVEKLDAGGGAKRIPVADGPGHFFIGRDFDEPQRNAKSAEGTIWSKFFGSCLFSVEFHIRKSVA